MPRALPHDFKPNPNVLRWARQRVALDVADAASPLDMSVTDLRAVERGDLVPSVGTLRAMSSVYHIPLLALVMPDIPTEPPLPTDFRTIHGRAPKLSPETIASIYETMERQSQIRELLEEDAEVLDKHELPLASYDDDPERLGGWIREQMGISVQDQLDTPSADDALTLWRTRIDQNGLFVFSRKLSREECRGFSFGGETPAPVIVVNDNEAPQAQTFTLFHEYAHLLVRDSALCLESLEGDRAERERFCNRVAAAVLMPPEAIERAIQRVGINPARDGWDTEAIGRVATRLRVSRPALILRLRDLGHDVEGLYEEAVHDWEEGVWREGQGGGGGRVPYHYRYLKSLGMRYVTGVVNAYERGVIGAPEAAEILGAKPKHFEGMMATIGTRSERYGRRTRR